MLTPNLQSLKETFADGLPAEIEKVKKLRKYVDTLSSHPILPLEYHH